MSRFWDPTRRPCSSDIFVDFFCDGIGSTAKSAERQVLNKRQQVLVVGLGLIGASLAKALRESSAAYVYGMDIDPAVPQQALQLGVIDQAVSRPESVAALDVIVIAVPVMAIATTMADLASLLDRAVAVTDVGSVKGAVIEQVGKALGHVPTNFVPGHPIAGGEQSGLEAANAALFANHTTLLTPLKQTQPAAIQQVTQMWQASGAKVIKMELQQHDEILAATSHLPHLLAFSLIDTLAGQAGNREIFRYAAGGLRDFSRIAASDVTMWHDIFLSNGPAVLKVLRRFQADLQQLEQAIAAADGDTLRTVFTRAKAAREHFTALLRERNPSVDS